MHPAFSVIFLTTLLGAGQGLFLALFTGQVYASIKLIEAQSTHFYVLGSLVALLLLIIGLTASFFHLGRPERAWRAATRWQSSWLSREVIILPILMACIAGYALAHQLKWTQPFLIAGDNALPIDPSTVIGFVGALAAFLLFLCTAMIYASVKFLQTWHSPLTVANFTFLGLASGFMLAAAYSAYLGNDLVTFYGTWAVIFTLVGLAIRITTVVRMAHLKSPCNLQSAIGVRHRVIVQKSQGCSAGSFNTREFFHHTDAIWLLRIRQVFFVLVFFIPIMLIGIAYSTASPTLPIVAFLIQYLGLLAERWSFFAEAQHPQNLYYQTVS
jgi:DMSO reductase anchor subunit